MKEKGVFFFFGNLVNVNEKGGIDKFIVFLAGLIFYLFFSVREVIFKGFV